MVATGVVRQQYLRLFGSVFVLLGLGACRVYEPSLIDRATDAGALGSDDASVDPAVAIESAATEADAGVLGRDASPLVSGESARAETAATDAQAPQDPSCQAGDCWWSADRSSGCRSAGRPGPQHRPLPEQAATDSLPAIYLGWTHLELGGAASEDDGAEAWQRFGLDLDGVCSNSASCSDSAQSCRAASSEIPFDGSACRDNRFARVQSVLSPVPEIGERYGLREETFNCNLRRGTYNMILKLSDYNGQPDDPEVRADFYVSPGLTRLPPWNCKDGDAESYPFWNASAEWQVDPTNLTDAIPAAGSLPASSIADSKAFVRQGYLVAELPDGAQLRLGGASNTYRSFALTTRKSLWTGSLRHMQDGTWQVEDGLVAGITLASDLLETFHELGLCQQSEQAPDQASFYQLVSDAIRNNADMLADGRVDENASCDALSFAIAFRAAQLTPGLALAAPERITCCPPSMSPEDCQPECGDGVVSGSEFCDSAIALGQPGDCPLRCSPIDACTPQRVTGTADACDAHCVPAPITRARAGDGCCPEGANANTDSDCASQCGNGSVEGDETCEPSSGCPTACTNEDSCMVGELTGSPEACNVTCRWTQIELCRDDDGCCPSGCDQTEDEDCSSSCGNRVLEQGERCEDGTGTPCPTSCDDRNACTRDTLSGSASSCDARCTHRDITEAVGGDGCCPSGANSGSDSDCAAQCGNGTREGSEQCDDGNTRSGDGCSSDCKSEGSGETESTQDQCLELLGNPTDSCNGCVCSSCDDEVIACRGATKGDEAEECIGVIECALEKRCVGVTCYCQAGAEGCTSGTPDGPCRKEVEAAAHSTDPSTVFARFNDTSYPIGRVMRVTTCWLNSCSSSCQP
jgi:cysteine-rich repeat protein